jgi:hypothetical protein
VSAAGPGTIFARREHIARINGRSGMASSERRYGPGGGLTIGGILVIVGVVVIIFWSFWIGLIIALIGLIAFGGFARGRWY